MRPHPIRARRFQAYRRLCPTASPVPSFGARSAGPSSRGFSETGMACTTAVRGVDWAAAAPQRQARRLAHTVHRDASASRAAAHAPWWPGDINKNKRFERRPKSVPRTNAQPFLYRGDTAAPPPPPRGARHAPTPHTGQTVPNTPAPLSDGAACALLWSPIGRPRSRGFSETGMACTTAVGGVDWAAAVPQR